MRNLRDGLIGLKKIQMRWIFLEQ